MKVYKKDIYDFLQKVEIKALRSVEKKYDDMILDSKTKRTTEYIDLARVFSRKLESIYIEAQALVDKHGDLYRNSWSNLHYTLNSLENSLRYCNGIKASDVHLNEYENQLLLVKQEELDGVQKEYAKLMHYAKNNSAKETYELLKELGFDVSSLEQTEKTLIEKADKSKLFVCGENK